MMADEKPAKSRFGRIRGVGDGISDVFQSATGRSVDAMQSVSGRSVDAVQTVTGKSAAVDIAEFTEAYTEVLTGLHRDVEALKRSIGESERKIIQKYAEIQSELSRLQRITRILTVIAIVSVAVGLAAIVLAVAS